MSSRQPGYRFTRQATADLKDIYRYGRRRWGRALAERYAHQLQQCFTLLATQRYAGRRRDELQPADLYSFAQGSHVVFYQPQPYGVLIVRILHRRQDVARHLGSGEIQ